MEGSVTPAHYKMNYRSRSTVKVHVLNVCLFRKITIVHYNVYFLIFVEHTIMKCHTVILASNLGLHCVSSIHLHFP